MKHVILLKICLFIALQLSAQDKTISGRVLALPDSTVLPGASVIIKGTTTGTVTDADGHFSLDVPNGSTLVFSFIGYASQEIPVSASTPRNLAVILQDDNLTLGEVEIYSTGYQELPAERATGSFEQIDNELINRSTGTDIISRLEGVTNGLWFDKRLTDPGSGDAFTRLRIRGISTINADTEPLIVLNGFPYEGDVNNINPNDIADITLLKDAAAASIWGARASNGVIVITTKEGTRNQPLAVNFNANVTVQQTPDLFYNPEFLPASEFIGVEKMLFQQGFYDAAENNLSLPVLSPVVETLILERDGQISTDSTAERLQILASNDVRKDAERYLYRNSVNQQYALNLQGGTEQVQYYVGSGFDKNRESVVGNAFERVTFNTRTSFNPAKGLQLTAGINYTYSETETNGTGLDGVVSRFPYNRLASVGGEPLAVGMNYRLPFVDSAQQIGLLDWQYRPLEEINLSHNVTQSKAIQLHTQASYEFFPDLQLNFKYQYQHTASEREWLRRESTYYVRNLVNRFTQPDGTQVFPHGDILNSYYNSTEAHAGRLQLNFNTRIGDHHAIDALAGAEARQVHATSNGSQIYGYNDEVLTYQTQLDYLTLYDVRPQGKSRMPTPDVSLGDLTDRYISYFGNASYRYKSRYILSASARWDASNLFGVKTNQKGVPLWSTGVGWVISDEPFFNVKAVPYLKLRSTYGYNGNVNKEASAFVTSRYASYNYLVNLPAAEIQNPANPQLRWEKVRIWNTGIDVKLWNSRLSSSIEWYQKWGTDLLGAKTLDPTVGFIYQGVQSNVVNYANTKSQGMDVTLQTKNIKGAITWQTDVLFNYVTTEVTRFDNEVASTSITSYGNNANLSPREGEPLDGLYAIPWNGLNPSGGPLIRIDGQPSEDYAAYSNSLTFDSLVYIGLAVPPFTGAIRNTLSWKGLALSANITWKAGYYFRRSTIDYSRLFNNQVGHSDFMLRWQQPGDEHDTDVPSMPETADNHRDRLYTFSEVLYERGDHIRLQDVRICYTLSDRLLSRLPFTQVKIYGYARNLGIVWRANRQGLDPDYPNAAILPGKSFSIGISASF